MPGSRVREVKGDVARIDAGCLGSGIFKIDCKKTWYISGRKTSKGPDQPVLSLQSFLRKGVSLGYVGRNYNLKDLKKQAHAVRNFYELVDSLYDKCTRSLRRGGHMAESRNPTQFFIVF